jgi:DNA-binding LytR/AlgR family response regulator
MRANHKIMLKAASGYVFKPYRDILYFKSCDKYAELHSVDGSKQTVFESLARIEERLDCGKRCASGFLFFRIHRQYIAALHHAEKWTESKKIVLENDVELRVGRKYLEEMRRVLLGG